MCADVELEVEYRFEGVLFTLVKKTSTIPWSCQSFRLDSMSQWGWSLARTSCINSEWSITFGSINQNFRATNIPRSHMLLFLWLQHGMGTKWTFYTSAQNFLDIDTLFVQWLPNNWTPSWFLGGNSVALHWWGIESEQFPSWEEHNIELPCYSYSHRNCLHVFSWVSRVFSRVSREFTRVKRCFCT